MKTPHSSITIHQLLTHTSGLPVYSGPDYKEQSKEGLLRFINRETLEFPPGQEFLYSNTGFSVLALIIEHVTDRDFEEVVSDLFFKPNQIKIGFNLPDFKQDSFSIDYKKKRNKGVSYLKAKKLKENYWNLKGNAGFHASSEEIYKWHKISQYDSSENSILKAALYRPHFKRSDKLYQGYGWIIRTDNEENVNQISHGGSNDIMSCYWMYLPKDNIWMYISSNSPEFKATSLALEILKIIRGAKI